MEAQDYKKLVKALRECASDDPDCIYKCPYYNHDVCADDLKSDAAAAIEDLLESIGMLDQQRSYWIDKAAEYYNQLPKRGEWIYLYDGNYKCSECGEWYGVDETPVKSGLNYCPNCGAKMEVQE